MKIPSLASENSCCDFFIASVGTYFGVSSTNLALAQSDKDANVISEIFFSVFMIISFDILHNCQQSYRFCQHFPNPRCEKILFTLGKYFVDDSEFTVIITCTRDFELPYFTCTCHMCADTGTNIIVAYTHQLQVFRCITWQFIQ